MTHHNGSSLSDIDLAAALAARYHAASTAWRHVIVNVSNGIVTLEGEVENAGMRLAAEDLARRFYGVVDVVNALTPRAAP